MAEKKAKTIDGTKTPLASINVDPPKLLENAHGGPLARLAHLYRRLNQVMSGMYTGVGCAGTPHAHHSYDEEKKANHPAD